MSPALIAVSPGATRMNENDPLGNQYQKGVKHLSDSGITSIPLKYILPISERPTNLIIQGKPDNLQLPIIDFADLQGPKRSQALNSLASACENYGFFQLVNHGIPNEVISNMMDAAKRFFAQPATEREKYMSSDMTKPVRYGTSFNQLKDSVFCWRDFLKLVCHPLADVISHWPSSPVDFRELAVTYAKETKFLFLMIVDAILESLGIAAAATTKNRKDHDEDDEILNELKDGSHQIFINYYPTCPEPDLTVGLRSHSDFGYLTLLLQNEVAGLQIKHQEKWHTVEPIPGAFVINVGDQLEIFSNGRYKSVIHRALANSNNSRISVASIHSLPFQSVLRPSKMLINETNPRHYKDITCASFLDYIKSSDYKEKSFLESITLTSTMDAIKPRIQKKTENNEDSSTSILTF